MERLGVVTVLGGRPWRAFAGPVAFLLAATVAIGLLRGELRHGAGAPAKHPHSTSHSKPAPRHAARKLYVVRAGDTIDGISSRTGIPSAQLLRINPKISPTALFIGEKIRLR